MSGWPVRTLEGVPVTGLEIGQKVIVMSLLGPLQATVTEWDREPTPEPQQWYDTKKLGAVVGAFAETEHSVFPLRQENGQWVGSSSWSKKALERFAGVLARDEKKGVL